MNPPTETPPAPRRDRESGNTRRAGWVVAIAVLILLIAGAFTIAGRLGEKKALAAETQRLAVPTVSVIHPLQEQAHEELVLPATVEAYQESPIYARTNGYVLRWYKDIGAHVKKGELLADIDTPE